MNYAYSVFMSYSAHFLSTASFASIYHLGNILFKLLILLNFFLSYFFVDCKLCLYTLHIIWGIHLIQLTNSNLLE